MIGKLICYDRIYGNGLDLGIIAVESPEPVPGKLGCQSERRKNAQAEIETIVILVGGVEVRRKAPLFIGPLTSECRVLHIGVEQYRRVAPHDLKTRQLGDPGRVVEDGRRVVSTPNHGLAESVTAGAVPIPLSAIVCGLPGRSLPATLSVAFRVTGAEGVKIMATVQLAPPANVPVPNGHVVPAPKKLKSLIFVPVIVMNVNFSVPVFAALLMVSVCEALGVFTN
jgi:hypothetical protein